jgi:hypothetical protein
MLHPGIDAPPKIGAAWRFIYRFVFLFASTSACFADFAAFAVFAGAAAATPLTSPSLAICTTLTLHAYTNTIVKSIFGLTAR